jgi:hypothetical protein
MLVASKRNFNKTSSVSSTTSSTYDSNYDSNHSLDLNTLPLSVYVTSINMGNAMPTLEDVAALIPPDGDGASASYDIVVVGMQESIFSINPEDGRVRTESGMNDPDDGDGSGGSSHSPRSPKRASAVTPPAPSEPYSLMNSASPIQDKKKKKKKNKADTFVGKLSAKLKGVTTSVDTSKNKFSRGSISTLQAKSSDTEYLHATFKKHLPSFTPIVRYQRGEMRLHIYLRNELIPALTDATVSAENTGIGHVLANKGGIAARICISSTALSFVSCHLNAHEGEGSYNRRCLDLQEILSGCKVAKRTHDCTILSHHTFLLGDLNYRVAFPGMDKTMTRDHAYDLCVRRDFKGLSEADELKAGMARGDCLIGFKEGDLSKFPPTFKVKRGNFGDFVSNKSLTVDGMYASNRTPSYW